jgi:integrase
MSKHQTGQIILRSDVFYIRYHENGKRVARPLRFPDGSPVRRDDRRFKSVTSKAVRTFADEFMTPINKAVEVQGNCYDLKVTEFWDAEFLPWATDVKKMRPSTLYGYRKGWSLYLEPHFKGRTLRDYRVSDGSGLLTDLAMRGLGRNTLQHVKGLARHVFAYAVSIGRLERNVWKEGVCNAKVKDDAPTHAYTIEEAKAIRQALASRADVVAVFDFCFCLGLRPSEVSALRWEHRTGDAITVQQAAIRGDVSGTKTGKVMTHRLIEPLKSELATWHEQCGSPDIGYIFPSAKGGPCNIESLVAHGIKPTLKAAGIAWSGLYSARRGHGTAVTRLESLTAARQRLGHSTEVTTAKHYALKDQVAGDAGLAALEAAIEGTNSGTKLPEGTRSGTK